MSASIEPLVLEIRKKAEVEAEKIISEAKREAERIVAEAREKAKKIPAERLREIERRLAEKERVRLAETRIEGRKMLLRAKMNMIERALSEAIRKVHTYVNENKGYREILKKLSVEAILALGVEEVVLMGNERDIDILKTLAPEITEMLKSEFGKNVTVKVSDAPINVVGGVIAATSDGKVYYNNSIDARIIAFKEEKLSELEKILFGES